MHAFLINTISVLVVLGIMVLVHEFGHFIAAKACGVRVEQFSIGFPPRLLGFKIGETDYCISAIPLGGYVKMTGESMPGENMSLKGADGETIAAQKLDPGALTSHPRWQRIIIGAAGPFANFVLAIALMTGFFMLHNQVPLFLEQPATIDWVIPGTEAAKAGLQPGDRITSYDSQPNPTWQIVSQRTILNLNRTIPIVVDRGGQSVSSNLFLADKSNGQEFSLEKLGILPAVQQEPVKVASVSAGTPAARAGIQQGDIFLSVDGHPFHGTSSVVSYIQTTNCNPVTVRLSRGGTVSTVSVQPVLMDVAKDSKGWRMGFVGAPPPSKVEQLAFGPAVQSAYKFAKDNSLLILEVLNRLVSRRMSVDSLSGPIGIAQQTGQAWSSGDWEQMIQLMTVISLNLGILNLLPFPILDGGMILFLIIESIIRRDVNVVVKERVYQVAFVLIIAFFGFIMYNDIAKLRTPPVAATPTTPCLTKPATTI
jgi:regulator of sigma E protease